jgi:hypothetical protein
VLSAGSFNLIVSANGQPKIDESAALPLVSRTLTLDAWLGVSVALGP